jgi:hypothetical protein
MRALTLAVVNVLRLNELNSGSTPLVGERIGVIHVHVDGSATYSLRTHAGSREMDCQFVAVGKRIALVMM